MVKKMHALKEGNGTLLDNCIMMWGSGLEDGNKHRRDNLPLFSQGKVEAALKLAGSSLTPKVTRQTFLQHYLTA